MKDLIEQGQIELVWTPTEHLVADILTKPMSGGKFQYLLFKLIGWNNIMDDNDKNGFDCTWNFDWTSNN